MKKTVLFIITLIFLLVSNATPPIHRAKAVDEWDWQSSGYDFRTLSYSDYDFTQNKTISRRVDKIGSLSGWRMELDENNLPRFSAYPMLGFREGEGVNVSWGFRMPPSLGLMRPVDFPTSFDTPPESSGDWVHREFIYQYGSGKTFRVLMSRISPAILLTTNADGMRIFDGEKNGIRQLSDRWTSVEGGTFSGNPRYFAIPTIQSIQVRKPDESGNLNLAGISQKWFLMWLGQETYLWGTNKVIKPDVGPASSSFYNPNAWLYPVDMPVMVVLEKNPESIYVDPNGGVEIRFGIGTPAGQIAMMPLLGSKFPPADETESWSAGLPADIETQAKWWYQRLGQFPISVRESYDVDPVTHDVQIISTFTYRSLGFGIPFAPIPPVVALAWQEGFPIYFSQNVSNSQMPLSIGPYMCVDNATSYTYKISGLAKYALEERVVNTVNSEPDWIKDMLNMELEKVVDAGHLAPWWPRFGKENIFYEMAIWSLPWETPYYLGETLEIIADPIKTYLLDYIVTERQAFRPESYVRTVDWLNTVQTIPYDQGTRRESSFIITTQKPNEFQNPYNRLMVRSLLTFYTLAQYYAQTGDQAELNQQWNTIKGLLQPYVQNSDWSTMTMTPYTWPMGRKEDILRGGISETNRLVAGSTGLVRLARMATDSNTEKFGLFILNKALVSRFAQEKLAKYLYEAGIQSVPPDEDWLVSNSLAMGGGSGEAILWRQDWSGYQDDIRRPLRFDQFGVFFSDSIPKPKVKVLLTYADVTPELGRFLSDYASNEAREWVQAVEENSPLWFITRIRTYLGIESPYSLPQNAYQVFLVKDWILNDSPENLASYLDIPWVPIGDYYYIHKVAETIKSYRGFTWQEVP